MMLLFVTNDTFTITNFKLNVNLSVRVGNDTVFPALAGRAAP